MQRNFTTHRVLWPLLASASLSLAVAETETKQLVRVNFTARGLLFRGEGEPAIGSAQVRIDGASIDYRTNLAPACSTAPSDSKTASVLLELGRPYPFRSRIERLNAGSVEFLIPTCCLLEINAGGSMLTLTSGGRLPIGNAPEGSTLTLRLQRQSIPGASDHSCTPEEESALRLWNAELAAQAGLLAPGRCHTARTRSGTDHSSAERLAPGPNSAEPAVKKRIEKRKAFVCLLAALGLVAGAGLFSLTTRVRYRHHKRGGEEALRSRAFPDAIRALARAERLWVFGRQLCLGPSDLGSLIETVQALAVATKGAGLELPTGEYLSALLSVQRVRGWNKASDRETCRREWMRLRKARLELRTQLRRLEANSRAEPVHVRL